MCGRGDVGVCLVQWGEEDIFRSHVIFTTHFGYDPTLGAHTKPLPYAKRDARFRKVLGACGMHGAVGAGRRRRRSWMQGHVLPAVIRPRRPRCRSAAPGGHLVAGFAVLRAPGRVPRAGAAPDLALAGWPPAWTTLMARAREAREHAAPPRGSASTRQTVQHATTRCRGQPYRSEAYTWMHAYVHGQEFLSASLM